MKQVCVLGNGQLGRMLRQAGEPLDRRLAGWPGCRAYRRAGTAERHYRRD